MTDPRRDPLEALRAPVAPVDPDPGFADALRARLERALLDSRPDPEEDEMTGPTSTLRTVTPYLAVHDARAMLGFYVEAFGAVPRGEPIEMPDGRLGHAEIALGDSVVMLADEFPEMGLLSPAGRGGTTVSLRLEVVDPDAVVERALAHGARLERAVADHPYGRNGVVVDPSGHRWMVSREA